MAEVQPFMNVKKLTLSNILAVHESAHNKLAIHQLLMEYYDALDGTDATSPKCRDIVKRVSLLDTSTTAYPMAIRHSIIDLRNLKGGDSLPATMWTLYDKKGIKTECDDRILEVKHNTDIWAIITFKMPVDQKTACEILGQQFSLNVCNYFGI